ncbi:pentapeptide repeat-containing protein [Micromonospora sp. WMMD956]|uniref:pentapeptide repeat-containing protein n=1 Tax=Micromonospora sp. WMMD956 TaxID=3016108 RepID=UPI002415F3BB|nr:pentapeptide repeat-containing protein [Micromonospora sp. WMMD956]MDG4817488.1 pentapeptide repeat-containing protein [Micromonospora sp. WMMD956]
MRTTTVGELRILLPELDPDDLDTISDPTDDLSDATIEDALWRGVMLDGVTIRGSRLVGVDVSESSWDGGSLFGCEITRADLSGATLSGVSIERCAVTGSRFTGARLTDIRLKDVLFEGCRFDYASLTRVTAAGAMAFVDCLLTDATWSSCRLPNIVLRSCQLARLELDSCHLHGADLRGNGLYDLKTGLGNLHGVTLNEDQLPDLTHLAVQDLHLTVRKQ